MIEINEIFSDSDKRVALWCEDVGDTNDLATMADYIIKSDVHFISVPFEIVPLIWVYLEKFKVQIYTRFDVSLNQKNIDADIYNLAANITSVCKKGADGIQLFVSQHDFESLVDKILPVRDDLFFGHDLSIALDIEDIDINNWGTLFQKLRDLRIKALVLTLNEDMKHRSDFVGRVYGMLQNWDIDCELHFILNNNFDRMDQVIRLVESEKPELSDKLHFFLDY